MDSNEQTILELPAALKREVTEAQVRTEGDDAQLNEISRINNELVNAQRELASAAEAARHGTDTLKASEERYRRLFESAKDGILILDAATGKIEDVNPYLCQLLEYTPDDFVGKQLWEIGTFRDIATNQETFRHLQETEYVRYDDLPLETKGGKRVAVEFVSNVYVSGDKKVIQCNIRDIRGMKQAADALRKANDELEVRVAERTSELAEANEELRTSEARLLSGNHIISELFRGRASSQQELENVLRRANEACCEMLDVSRCSIWLFDDNHSAIHCLDLYVRETALRSQGMELKAQDFPGYFDALKLNRTIVANDAHTHAATREFSQSYLKPLGIFAMLNTSIVMDGQMAGVLCCEQTGKARTWNVEDQTLASTAAAICSLALESYERARSEIGLRQAKDEADAANRAKSEFLSRMSHELRTPLNAILGFGQLLAKQDFSPRQQEQVGYILKAGRHLLDLINEVLEIARIESGHMLLSLEPVPVGKTLEEVFSLLRPLAAEEGIQLQGDDRPELEVQVWADAQRFKQVLLNLCANAIKYNRPLGTVTVSCQTVPGIPSSEDPTPGDQLRLNMTDTGLGIAKESQTQLFTPFMRVGAAQTTIEGTGLGLALSLSLTHAMKGTIGVESTVGVGSTFWVQFPLAPAPLGASAVALAHGVASPDVTTAAANVARRTLLYVEDNLSNLHLIKAIIADQPGYELISAMQGQMGLDLARQHHPDLILLDLHLPDVPGDQVLARLKADPTTADIPVVILSAVAADREIKRLLDGGAAAYLTKPLDIDLFLDTVNTILPPRTPVS